MSRGLSAADIRRVLELRNSLSLWHRRPWSLQYASNLRAHKDWRAAWSSLVPGAGENLLLLGNCVSSGSCEADDNTFEFLARCSNTWKNVFIVPGPLELAALDGPRDFWAVRDTLDATVEAAAGLNGNIKVMEADEHEFEGKDVVLIGTSMWSDCHKLKAFPKGATEEKVFTTDANGQRPIRPDDLREWSSEDINWLAERVGWWQAHRPGVRIVVATHTLPSGHLLERGAPPAVYKRAAVDVPSFEALKVVFAAGTPRAWLAGATGSCISGMARGGSYCASNGLYLGETDLKNENYMPDRTLTFDTWERPTGGGGAGSMALLPQMS